MSAAKLKTALEDCLINFDRRVLLTDLLNEYELPYEDVQETLAHYLQQQEKQGTKYEKRFLVHGMQSNGETKEIYTVVKGEKKLKEWLAKLTQAESSLYSVEVVGGAKAPAEDLKPVRWCAIKLDNPQMRTSSTKTPNVAVNNITNGKPELKQEVKKTSGIGAFVKKESTASTSAAATAKQNKDAKAATISKTANEPSTKRQKKSTEETSNSAIEKKPSPAEKKLSATEKKPSPTEKKPSPTEKKPSPTDKKSTNQRGINNFFAASSKKAAANESKAATNSKPKSPKKMQDFFKTQAEKPKKTDAKKDESKTDTSVELLSDDDKEKEVMEVDSSDEEENLQALRRKAKAGEEESEEETAVAESSSIKRRRIVDTDDEEDESPQQKHEKKEEKQESTNATKSATYLDDDGFVITIKSKKPSAQPAAHAKTPVKAEQKLESKPKATAQPAPKTKQGNIMSFFSKK